MPKDDTKTPPILLSHGYILTNELLGSGTFSSVYGAYSKTMKFEVAVKVIQKVAGVKVFLTKFLPRELQIMKELQHPNIINFIQALETNLKIYIILERVRGPSLLLLVQVRGRLMDSQAANILFQLLNGIGYCHNKGISHRDLKAENILLDYAGIVRIIDFGFARAGFSLNERESKSTTFCGSYAYACPEILRGVPYIPPLADIWSLGVILYIMVYGRLPFEDDNVKKLVRLIMQGPIFLPNVDVSSKCKKVINKLLSHETIRPYVGQIIEYDWFKGLILDQTMVTSSPSEFGLEGAG